MRLLTHELFPEKISNIFHSLISFGRDIKISHSIFAMPFAGSVFFVQPLPQPTAMQLGWLLLCMIFARSFAMGANRLLDWKIDRLNPRTHQRMIPSGKMTPHESLSWTLLAACLFIFCAGQLGTLTLGLSIPLLLFLAAYSLLKRYTWLTHFYLGLCLGLSPLAVQVAIQQEFTTSTLLLGLGIGFWTAGFDILYSLQDLSFDQNQGLKSVPSAFGPKASYLLTSLAFGLAILSWVCVGQREDLGILYGVGVGVVATILTIELWIVRDLWKTGQSQKLNQAFFGVNGWVSVVFLVFTILARKFS